MCRLLGYLGPVVSLDRLIEEPDHSLIVQSYKPREMTSGLLNADGFGLGWYRPRGDGPFVYRNTQPIWSDANLPSLLSYVESGCVVANVRSATPGLPVDLSNCSPFRFGQMLATHNGFIRRFRETLYRRLREALDDEHYRAVHGVTDSEHIAAFVLSRWSREGGDLASALARALETLFGWGAEAEVDLSCNLIFTDGRQLVACRAANRDPVPSLYFLKDDPRFAGAVLVASEPLFESPGWESFPEGGILTVTREPLEARLISI
jgi:glutamine amidotransferase